MLSCQSFYDLLINKDISFFTGVPDSLLKDICGYITDNSNGSNNITAANEGAAIALAAGYYLATNKIGLVYMQNSGQGNSINPLLSLVDPDVYQIPVMMMIGWRGEPGKKDEPQHVKQGKVTLSLLDAVSIPYSILPDNIEEAQAVIEKANAYMRENKAPYAIVVKKGTFESYKLQNKTTTNFDVGREEAIQLIAEQLNEKDVIVSTTGKASRELFEYRVAQKQGHSKDFLTVGSMGHASQIALGIALNKPDRQVYCLDGDGAAIMHMGSLSITASTNSANFKHIVLNNGAHDSVGGQPTTGLAIDFPTVAKACGYKSAFVAQTAEEIRDKMAQLKSSAGPALLEIKVNIGARSDLGRPTTTPRENKEKFMEFLQK